MSNIAQFDQPFGTYRLPVWRENLRRVAGFMPTNRLGRLGGSLFRRLALMRLSVKLPEPYDIDVAPGVSARLYSSTNRCEKRAFAGVHQWDAAERAALDAALENCNREVFVFLDVGANVGLYSLFVSARARAIEQTTTIIAIEPDPTNRHRLEFNIAASGADILVEPVAISGAAGKGHLSGGDNNRGEVTLHSDSSTGSKDQPDAGSTPVSVETLEQVAIRHRLTYIDAMKVDIEGFDHVALKTFFKQAGQAIWPGLLIIETGRGASAPVLDLALANGYGLLQRSGINTILTGESLQ